MPIITMKAFLDAGSIFILLTLSATHFFVFAGRFEAREERANLYFSLIACLLACYVFLNSFWSSRFYLLTSSRIQPFLEGLIFLFVFIGFVRYLSSLTSYVLPKLPAAILLSVAVFLTLLTALPAVRSGRFDMNPFYFAYLFFPVTIGISIVFIATISPFILHIFRNRLYREPPVVFMLLGLTAILGRLIVSKAAVASHRAPDGNNWILAAACTLFAFALSERFNRDYRALRDLRHNLERKVTERTEELRRARDEITAMSEQKTALFMNLAHETRTPLTLIRYHLESWLSRKGDDEDLSIIRDNIRKLQRDMVNFLDTEKIRRGEILYDHTEPIDLPAFLTEKAALFRPLAERKGLEFRTCIEGDGFLLCDGFALDRVLNNLLLNAVKFTDTGSISLGLGKTADRWKLTVEDTGRGMDDRARRAIIEPYAFLAEKKENIRGYGMGLFITRKIVEELGGGIHVESSPGAGSVFTIDLPVHAGTRETSAPENPSELREFFEEDCTGKPAGSGRSVQADQAPSPEFGGKPSAPLVCIVEDNPELLGILSKELGEKFRIMTARGGNEALGLLTSGESAPDLIMSDIMMDDGDGESFFEAVHSNPRLEGVPFIFCSARSGEETVLRAFDRGAVEFVAKPFSMPELSARIASLISHSRRQKEMTIRRAISQLSAGLQGTGEPSPGSRDARGKERFESRCDDYGLSCRQKEIIELIGEGFEYKEIADRLSISGRTVTRHVQNVYERLGVHNKVELLNRLYGKNETAGNDS